VGERNEAKIAANAQQRNQRKARMINFGVGYDVNSRLLDRLSRDNYGQSEYVRPDEDIEAHVSSVYRKMGAPVMTDVAVKIDIEEAGDSAVSRVYPKHVYDLFAGEQLVLVGRYRKHGDAKITISGKVGERKEKFDFPAKFVERSRDQSNAFVERLWAMRRIGQIIDEIDLHGKNEELVKELVELSTRHGILTPYTSFLADENAPANELAETRLHLERAGAAVERLSEAEGISGFAQRADKFSLQNAQVAPAASAPAFADRALATDAAARGPSTSATPALQAGGYGGGLGGLARSRVTNSYRAIDSDRQVVADSIQQAGKETLFRRGQTWIANNAKDIDPVKNRDEIKEIKRFSDAYFDLVKANTPDENAILAAQQAGEELLVRFRGQAYLVK
jgi:Ca-activated chloride channel family protein